MSQRDNLHSIDVPNDPSSGERTVIKRELALWDVTNVVVGIVVGSAIFRAPPIVFNATHGAVDGLLLWGLGGLLALVGGLCYAELASRYPRVGGEYVYLTRAYGSFVGFLYGWSYLCAVMTGSIGALSFVFADYTVRLLAISPDRGFLVAATALIVLTLINGFGLKTGKTLQNIVTAAKVLGLLATAVAGFLCTSTPMTAPASPTVNYALAFIMVLYAFGGWSDSATVAAEVKNPSHNIPRALVFGILAVVAIYGAINGAYLHALGLEGLRATSTPAADVLTSALGAFGDKAMCLLVMASTIGGLNGVILTGSRIYAAMGAEHTLFRWLGHWDEHRNGPTRALWLQSLVAFGLMVIVGTEAGRYQIDSMLLAIGFQAVPWATYGGGFEVLVSATAPAYCLFFGLTGSTLFVLRKRDRDLPQPFRVPLYPMTPALFCLTAIYMFVQSVCYAQQLVLLVGFIAAIGAILYAMQSRSHR